MTADIRHYCFNIREYFISQERRDLLLQFISSFSCPVNPDIEHFLKHNAVEFTKKHQSVTYLVFSEGLLSSFVGYFAITVKPFIIGINDIPSNTWKRKIERVARFNEDKQEYSAAGYLIAQLGKNYAGGVDGMITGGELITIALNVIRGIQYSTGGMIVFVEAENKGKLIDFYRHNGFHLLSDPKSPREELIQFYRTI